VSDEINRVITVLSTRWQAERMLAKVLWEERSSETLVAWAREA
jgi:hypothetical protein